MTNGVRNAIVACVLWSAAAASVAAQSPTARAFTVKQDWSVDGTEHGEPFGDVRDVLALPDGSLWVLDYKDQQIRRYASNGRALGVTGRKGSGPGELRNANGMVLHADGNVWVNDPQNARFSVYRPDGTFLRQHALAIGGWGYVWQGWYDRTSRLLHDPVVGPGLDGKARQITVDGREVGTVSIPACKMRLDGFGFRAETKGKGADNRAMYGTYPFMSGGGATADGAGGYWCAPIDGTRAHRVSIAKGDTGARTDRTLAMLPVPAEERAAQIADLRKRVAGDAETDFDPGKVPNRKPPVTAISVDYDGRLWMRLATPWRSATTTFDVHDSAGGHLGRVTLPYKGNSYLRIQARGNRLWLVVLDDDDVVSVARFTITPTK
jgi:hypothetical protein